MQSELEERLLRLREDFDSSFAIESKSRRTSSGQFVAVQVAGGPYAFRTRDLLGISRAGEILPVPSAADAFVGIAGIRSTVVPVYSLAALLDLSGGKVPEWLALCGGGNSVALGFDDVTDYAEAGEEDSFDAQEGGFIRQAVRLHGTLHRIIDVHSILKHITEKAPENGAQER